MGDGDTGMKLNVNTGAGADISLVTGKTKTVLEHNRERQQDEVM